MRYAILVAMLALAGCSTPVQYTDKPMAQLNKDTTYRVDDRPGGFTVTVSYSSYTFMAEPAAIASTCKQTLTSLAHDLAEKQGRRIKPIDEQRIKISTGYNGITGVTSCSASAPADWL